MAVWNRKGLPSLVIPHEKARLSRAMNTCNLTARPMLAFLLLKREARPWTLGWLSTYTWTLLFCRHDRFTISPKHLSSYGVLDTTANLALAFARSLFTLRGL